MDNRNQPAPPSEPRWQPAPSQQTSYPPQQVPSQPPGYAQPAPQPQQYFPPLQVPPASLPRKKEGGRALIVILLCVSILLSAANLAYFALAPVLFPSDTGGSPPASPSAPPSAARTDTRKFGEENIQVSNIALASSDYYLTAEVKNISSQPVRGVNVIIRFQMGDGFVRYASSYIYYLDPGEVCLAEIYTPGGYEGYSLLFVEASPAS